MSSSGGPGERKTIAYLNSALRDAVIFPNCNNCSLRIDPIKNVSHIRILNVIIPNNLGALPAASHLILQIEPVVEPQSYSASSAIGASPNAYQRISAVIPLQDSFQLQTAAGPAVFQSMTVWDPIRAPEIRFYPFIYSLSQFRVSIFQLSQGALAVDRVPWPGATAAGDSNNWLLELEIFSHGT